MLKLTARLMPGTRADIYGRLELPFDRRQKSRLRATLASGEEVALMLPAGAILRGGDLIASADGRIIEVVAVPETLLHVECATPAELTRTAYHLGNRHVPVQVAAGFLRLTQDHVLEEMLRMLGAKVMHIEAPFEPEGGAYSGGSGGHRHHGEARNHGARIHEYK